MASTTTNSNVPKIFLMTTFFVLFGLARADPVLPHLNNTLSTSKGELADLNKAVQSVESSQKLSPEPTFTHRDEDQPRTAVNNNLQDKLKYDVEVLEAREVKKENMEIEERFKGPSIYQNTDTIVEDIEVNSSEGSYLSKKHNLVLTLMLTLLALLSVGLYLALIMWRSYLERRYGMRELLVTSDDDFSSEFESTPRFYA